MATKTCVPTGTVSGWAISGDYTEIDETIASANDTDYIETTTVNDVAQYTLTDMEANTSNITQVSVDVRGYIDDDSNTAKIQVDLFHSGNTAVTGNPKYLSGASFGTYGTHYSTASPLTWTGLSLTKAQGDSLEVRFTFLET